MLRIVTLKESPGRRRGGETPELKQINPGLLLIFKSFIESRKSHSRLIQVPGHIFTFVHIQSEIMYTQHSCNQQKSVDSKTTR